MASEAPDDRIAHLCELAHEQCNIAKSLTAEVTVEPLVERT